MIEKLIGNTPIARIKTRFKGEEKNIFIKLEYYNFTGSIKDRLAYGIITKSYQDGVLKNGMPIIEATSGNTGISFSAIGSLMGHKVYIFMPDWASKERIQLMQMYGASVTLISKEDGGFRECIRRADLLAKDIDGFRPNQFTNNQNIEIHYNTTGQEILNKLNCVDTFVSGFGTGGTLMGVGKKLKEKFPNIQVIAMEPKNMSLLSQNKTIGEHKIEGIGDDFLPELIDKNFIDGVITVSDEEAINMSKILAKNLGLGVGISSGANFFASVKSKGKNIVTIFADDNKKYLSTDLFVEFTKAELESDSIEFLEFESL